MNLVMCKSKIHRARVTESILDYEGSLEIDTDIMKEVGLYPYEKILVVNASNGHRFETYAIPGKAGSRCFKVNGAAAHRASPGDTITVMSFGICTEDEARKISPKIIVMDDKNGIVVRKGRSPLADL
ncbi:MAG TPA: aspartate 1-decarboxylase [Lentisphaeria bacterium]|nr:MAG: aspartate 1-decarboxylase [Lentisphaerae bacterium GWF2_50_93]HCE42925.1 aspartate 1-decarboxylase [Lentisphaeria bacterium]